MSIVPGNLKTDQQPPMAVPLRHFVVGLVFLLTGVVIGVSLLFGVLPGLGTLAHVHLLLVGWVCVTIMGAMTQFVPVWSGTQLYSRRLSTTQLWLVAIGLLGFGAGLLSSRLTWLPVFGMVMLVGFWIFVYNIGQTLRSLPSYDITERHFGFALGSLVVVTVLGVLLGIDFVVPIFDRVGVQRANIVAAHATFAVFGVIIATVLGALYQLATMFTQTDLHGVDTTLRRIEEVAYPAGVLLLATGRLLNLAGLARLGGAFVLLSLFGFNIILIRRLYETNIELTPMLARYAVVVPALALWTVLSIPAWIVTPLAPTVTFGSPTGAHLLLFGVVGFVLFGTMYHIIPFIVWVHRYSDLLGYEPVPMIEDLYHTRLATADFACLFSGFSVLVAGELLTLPQPVVAIGGILSTIGIVLFLVNMLLVIRTHSPQSIPDVLFGTSGVETEKSSPEVTDISRNK